MTAPARVGIVGGTFDPIHVGHLAAASAAQEALALGEVRFIPSNRPPHRPGGPLASGAERLEMTALAVAGRPGWSASDLELRRDGPSYTFDTLQALHADGLRPEQIFFVIGADAFADIRKWSRFPAVLDAAHFVVIERHGTPIERLVERLPDLTARVSTPAQLIAEAGTRIVLIAADTPDVSATQVRERASRGEDLSDLVPPPVAAFIGSRGLYRTSGGSRSTAVASGR